MFKSIIKAIKESRQKLKTEIQAKKILSGEVNLEEAITIILSVPKDVKYGLSDYGDSNIYHYLYLNENSTDKNAEVIIGCLKGVTKAAYESKASYWELEHIDNIIQHFLTQLNQYNNMSPNVYKKYETQLMEIMLFFIEKKYDTYAMQLFNQGIRCNPFKGRDIPMAFILNIYSSYYSQYNKNKSYINMLLEGGIIAPLDGVFDCYFPSLLPYFKYDKYKKYLIIHVLRFFEKLECFKGHYKKFVLDLYYYALTNGVSNNGILALCESYSYIRDKHMEKLLKEGLNKTNIYSFTVLFQFYPVNKKAVFETFTRNVYQYYTWLEEVCKVPDGCNISNYVSEEYTVDSILSKLFHDRLPQLIVSCPVLDMCNGPEETFSLLFKMACIRNFATEYIGHFIDWGKIKNLDCIYIYDGDFSTYNNNKSNYHFWVDSDFRNNSSSDTIYTKWAAVPGFAVADGPPSTTPLHLAIYHNNIALIELLINRGANIRIKEPHVLKYAQRKSPEIAAFLEKALNNK